MKIKCRVFGHKWGESALAVSGPHAGMSRIQCDRCPHNVMVKYGTKPPNPAIIKHRFKLRHWTV